MVFCKLGKAIFGMAVWWSMVGEVCAESQQPLHSKHYDTSEFAVVENPHFDRLVVNSSIDFNQYTEIILFPMTFDRMKISQTVNQEFIDSWNDSTWKEMDKICGYFDTFAKRKFKNAKGMTMTKRGDKNVLAVEFRLQDLVPDAKKDSFDEDANLGSSYSGSGIGGIIYTAVIADSQSGQLLAIIEDGRYISFKGIPFDNRVGRNRAWRAAFKEINDEFYKTLRMLQEKSINELSQINR